MRITLLSFVFLFLTQLLPAQTDFRFADSTAQWNILISENSWSQSVNTAEVLVIKDTIIDNLQYQAINVRMPLGAFFAEEEFVRDTANKVYRRDNTDTIEHFIYDFGRQTGDTFYIDNGTYPIYCHVDSVDTVILDKPRKRMYISNCYYEPCSDVWIEGIGSIGSFFLFPDVGFAASDGPDFSLLCYFENNQLLYHNFLIYNL